MHSTTRSTGITYVSPPMPTPKPSMIASVSGRRILIEVPASGQLSIAIEPRSAAMRSRTTSIPMPRPDHSVTLSAVENPGSKTRR